MSPEQAAQVVSRMALALCPNQWTAEVVAFWIRKMQPLEFDLAVPAAEELVSTWRLVSPPNWSHYTDEYIEAGRRRVDAQRALPAAPARVVQGRDRVVWQETVRIMQDVEWWVARGWPDAENHRRRFNGAPALPAGHNHLTCRYCSEQAAAERTGAAHAEAVRRADAGEIKTRGGLQLGFAGVLQ